MELVYQVLDLMYYKKGYKYKLRNLIIIDMTSLNIAELNSKFKYNKDEDIVLALTPVSFYYLEMKNIKYYNFHDIISKESFKL